MTSSSSTTVDANTIATTVIGEALSTYSAPAKAATASAITFTVKDRDIVVAKVADIKKHPEGGVLVIIEGNPWAYLPQGQLDGENAAGKAARRDTLIATPGAEVTVKVVGTPFVDNSKGKPQGRISVSEQKATAAAHEAAQKADAACRDAELQATLDALVGKTVQGKVKDAATKPSDRDPGKLYTYGVFVEVAGGLTGLLHSRQVESGTAGLNAIIAKGVVTVEVLGGTVEKGRARIELSQVSVASKALVASAAKRVGHKVKGEIVKVGEVVGNLHGRIIKLGDGAEVFLADDDANVKNEASLARGNTTSATITGEVVGGMLRVSRR